jgi:ABC-type Zn2+ transport system substrate-binding protein/surface adhesin
MISIKKNYPLWIRWISIIGFMIKGIIGCKEAYSSQKTIMVSIAPLYSLTLNLIKNIAEFNAQLLIDPKQSGHCARLKPSQIISIKNASLIIVVGSMYETSLWPQLLKTPTTILSMADAPELIKKFIRCPHQCTHHQNDPHHSLHPSPTIIDGHFWLMPANAKAFCAYVKNYLMKLLGKSHKRSQLEDNYKSVIKRIDELEKTIHSILNKSVLYPHYWLYHDFMNYFDATFYHGTMKGMLTTDVTAPIRPSLIFQLQKDAHSCVIYLEPQFHHQSLQNFCHRHGIKTKVLDYIGYDHPPNEHSYFTTMIKMAKNISSKN